MSSSLMPFNAKTFLATNGAARTVRQYGRSETIFTPGDACEAVLYIRTGGVRLSAASRTGRVAELATLGPGEFFGEGCLAGQPVRIGCATAMTPSTIVFIAREAMLALLHRQPEMSDRFISHLLTRNIQIEEELIERLVGAAMIYRNESMGSRRAARLAGR